MQLEDTYRSMYYSFEKGKWVPEEEFFRDAPCRSCPPSPGVVYQTANPVPAAKNEPRFIPIEEC